MLANYTVRLSRHAGGFTLLELMVGITVLALVLGIGVPTFTEMVRNNRQTAAVNQLVTSLNLARSEAVKRRIRVSLCPSNAAQDACDAAASWSQGWLIFEDDSGTAGTLDGSDEILQTERPTQGGFVYTTTASSIRFLPSRAEAAAQMEIHKSGCTGERKHRIEVLATGRIASTKVSC